MKVGDTISGYTLLQECGQGAFGKVFLAESVMGERVALKVVSALGSGADRELQALKNYQTCSKGTHLLQIYHAEKNDDYLLYVMELADAVTDAPDGQYIADTLDYRLKRDGKLKAEEALAILRNLLADLKILHNNSFIHSDIKPANVVFVHGEAKLGDIGLLANDSSCTLEAGTPLFMPPAESGIARNTREADLYALSMVTYVCISGKNPKEFPDLVFTDDLMKNGTDLVKYVNRGCAFKRPFHEIDEIYGCWPSFHIIRIEESSLELIKRNIEESIKEKKYQDSRPPEKNSKRTEFLENHKYVGFLLLLLMIPVEFIGGIIEIIIFPFFWVFTRFVKRK